MRRFLRKDDIRILRSAVGRVLGSESLLPQGSKVEAFPLSGRDVYVIDGEPVFFMEGTGILSPLLTYLLKFDLPLPHVTVDMKAVPHVCNGADVFRPGIREVPSGIKAGQLVVVVDERNRKPICVGNSIYDSETIAEMKSGKVIRNLHYVGDSIWEFSKRLQTHA